MTKSVYHVFRRFTTRNHGVREGGRGCFGRQPLRALFAGQLSDTFTKGRDIMSAFLEYGDFCGGEDAGRLSRSVRDFFELAADLRGRLGQKGYLLDNHLCILLGAAAANPVFSVSEQGFNNAGTELREVIRFVMRDEKEGREHPLYEKAKAYIDSHPLPYQENYTRRSLYFAALFGEFAEHAAAEYRRALERRIQNDAIPDAAKLREVRRSICDLLGGEADMERLEDLFRQCFLSVTPMAGFIQGMADSLISEIISRDRETSKLICQLMLDANLAGQE